MYLEVKDKIFELITDLINNRLRQDKIHKHIYRKEEVVKNLGLDELEDVKLLALAQTLGAESDIFNTKKREYNSKLVDFDYECPRALQKLIETGYVHIEWKNCGIDKKKSNDFQQLVDEVIGNNVNSLYVPPQQRSNINVFVTFVIDKLAKENLTLFPEIDLMTFVCNKVYNGLNLMSETKTLPVKPRRKRDGDSNNDVWCQLRCNFYANTMNEDSITFAVNEMGIDENSLSKNTRVEVMFALKDAVDTNNEWASCPLLHVGTNFKMNEFSQSFYDNIASSSTDKDNIIALKGKDSDREKNVCYVYSQKNPTLEIPAKHKETEVVIRQSLMEAEELYIIKQRVSDSLTVNLAFCHPKARMRHLFMTYITCVFARSVSNYDKTHLDNYSNEIVLGKDAILVSPVELEAGGYNNKVSRKISLSSDVCYACNNEKCKNCGRLVHDNQLPFEKKEYGNQISKCIKSKVIGNEKLEQYTMKPCKRASVVHNYFCKMTRVKKPIKLESYDNLRKKIVLFGKVRDVVKTEERFYRDEKFRKRVFFNNENDLEYTADSCFLDILVKKIDVEQAMHHLAGEEEIYKNSDKLESFFDDLEINNAKKEIIIDYMSRIAPSKEKIIQGVYSKDNLKKAVRFCISLLKGINQRNHATLLTMINKSMVIDSTLVIVGARCAVSNISGKTMVVRQFIAASKDMEMALVSENDLADYTVMEGSVSATTAPNDKLSFGACQTWKNKEVKTPRGNYSNFATNARRSFLKRSTPSTGKYIPPHLR